MYKVQLTQEQKDRLRRGDTRLLIALLEESDKNVVKDLKNNKQDLAHVQGASQVIDRLLAILKGA